LKPKSHALFFDTTLNSKQTVIENIYENVVLTGMKLHCYYTELLKRRNEKIEDNNFLNESIFGIAQYVHRLIVSRTKKTLLAKENNSDYTLTYQNTTWITLQALKFALKPKNSRYSDLLKKIDQVLHRSQRLTLESHNSKFLSQSKSKPSHDGSLFSKLESQPPIPPDNMTVSQLFLSHPFSTMLY